MANVENIQMIAARILPCGCCTAGCACPTHAVSHQREYCKQHSPNTAARGRDVDLSILTEEDHQEIERFERDPDYRRSFE